MTVEDESVGAYVAAAWRRAAEALEDATDSAERGRLNAAVNRAYYAVLHPARALLATKALRPKTHSGTQALLGREFITTGLLPRWMSVGFRRLLEARVVSDYDVEADPPDAETVRELVDTAARFLREARAFLSESGYELPGGER